MPVEHNILTGASLHEPLGIDSAGTVDAGKVITPSAVSAGEGVVRNLVESEVLTKKTYITMAFPSIDTVTDIFYPINFAGVIENIRTAINASFSGADTVLTGKINGIGITNGAVTIIQSGSAAGDVDTATPTANRTLAVGDYIQVTSDLAATSGVDANLIFEITRD